MENKNAILIRETEKAIKEALSEEGISFIDRLKLINNIIFEYKIRTYGSNLEND